MTRARSISRLVSDQVTGNVNISGILTATTLFGDGAGISGVTAVGSGVTILDNGINKGAASKIDFADHFLVTDISSGITTITVGVTTEYIDSKQINNAGVVTTGSAIVGTAVTINSSGLDVTGVITSTSFSGSFVGDLTGNSTGLSGSPNIIVNDLSVGSAATITELTIGAGGIEFAGLTTITNGGLEVIGIITATSFVGDGTLLSGIGTENVRTSSLVVSGVSTFNNDTYFQDSTHHATNPTRAYFGSADEMSVYSTGTFIGKSYNFIDADSGYLDVRNYRTTIRNPQVLTQRDLAIFDSETFNAEFVKLYYGGNEKFSTAGTGVTITGITSTNHLTVTGVATVTELNIGSAGAEIIGFTTITPGGIDVVGVVTATNGFVSSANTSPVQIQLVGNQLIFNVVGIGSTTLTLA